MEGTAFFVEIDVDQSEELAENAGITSVPTFQLFKNGQLIKKY